MMTLAHKRSLLNPFRHGLFAWMLASHKVTRWALPWVALAGMAGLAVLAPGSTLALTLLLLATGVILLGALGWRMAREREPPPVLSLPAFLLMSNVAAMHALVRALRVGSQATWEPTRRE